jgi:hypothetical protein
MKPTAAEKHRLNKGENGGKKRKGNKKLNRKRGEKAIEKTETQNKGKKR